MRRAYAGFAVAAARARAAAIDAGNETSEQACTHDGRAAHQRWWRFRAETKLSRRIDRSMRRKKPSPEAPFFRHGHATLVQTPHAYLDVRPSFRSSATRS